MNKKSQQGIALIWMILAGVLLISGIEAIHLSQAKRMLKKIEKEQVSQPEEFKKEIGEKGEEFVGKIKEIVDRNEPMKCTYTQGGYRGVSFIKGKKAYSEISGGKETQYMIVKDNCMWNWGRGAEQGTKMCFGKNIWETTEALSVEAEYRCVAATFSNSEFEPPADINFITSGEAAPLSDEDLLKILPPKERSELESAIREAQEVLKEIEVFTPPTIDDIKGGLKGLDQISKQSQEEIQKNVEKQKQEFQPPQIDTKKIEEYFKQNPPAVPYEGEKEPSLEEQEYYYRKYILKDPAVQW